jgi:Sulfotransferase family
MILSTGRKYVFVHIPKTGGTSLALALEGRAMKDDIMLGDTPKARKRRHRVKGITTKGRLWKHSTLSDIDGLVADGILDGLFAFTLVRNPWDRAVSYYHWLLAQSFDHPAVRLAQGMEFAGFVSHPATIRSFRQTPAASYMRRADGREHCDSYIRVEHFQQDSTPLVAHLGFAIDLPVSNTSDRYSDFRRYYTDRTAQIIADCCADDVAAFGYSFG